MQVNNCINNHGFEVNGPKLITKNVFKDQRGFSLKVGINLNIRNI